MPMLGVLLIPLAVDRAVPDLQAMRAQSPIPAWCDGAFERSALKWQSAANGRRVTFCTQLARGYGMLASAPQQAIAHADQAAKVFPEQGAPAVLSALAHATLGEYREAWQGFDRARQQPGFTLPSAAALHQFARAARLGASADVANTIAVSAYRQLLGTLAQYDDDRWRSSGAIEAAIALLSEESSGLPQAAAVMSEVPRWADSTQYPQTVRALSLLLRDWLLPDGHAQPAKRNEDAEVPSVYPEALLAELSSQQPMSPKLLEIDRDALLAFSWEHWDVEQARDRWLAVAARDPQGSWHVLAERRARSLAK
jgi:hypothetical protein